MGPRLRHFARRPMGELTLGSVAGAGLGMSASSFDACSRWKLADDVSCLWGGIMNVE